MLLVLGPILAVPGHVPSWLHWFYHLGRFFVDNVLGTVRSNITPAFVGNVLVFLLLLAVAYYVGKWVEHMLRRSVLRPPRVDAAMARLMGHLTVFACVLVGFSVAITIFGTSIAELATGLGLLTLALGFGMQNTVANLMGGVSLAVDKPFRPGDRIQVGDYWGTVQTIGLRSTRIVTPRKEVVIVPNKIMEEREIWNYTMFSSEYRLDIPVTIPYSADWRKAEQILQAVGDAHPNTLRYRPSQVVFRQFGEAGVEMQLRVWIADVTARPETQSDLLKGIRDRFAIAGIELPYPHRTLIVHQAAEEETWQVPAEPYAQTYEGQPRILVVVDPQAPEARVEFCTKLAKALPAGLLGLFVHTADSSREDGEFSLRFLGNRAREQRVWYKPLIRRGDPVSTIEEVAIEEGADMILTGLGRGRIHQLWRRHPDVGARLRDETQRPVVTIPHDLRLTPEFVENLRGQIREFRDRRLKLAEEEAQADQERQAAEKPEAPAPSGASDEGSSDPVAPT